MSMMQIETFDYQTKKLDPLPLPAAGELHLWWTDADASPHKSGQSRRVLMDLLSRYLAVPETEIVLGAGTHGKPFLRSPYTPLFFNLSHAGTKMVFLFSTEQEVGIDLETPDHPADMDQIAARFFHPEERYELEKLSGTEKREKFFRFWTMKEALLKGQGVGLTRETFTFTFDALPDGSWQVRSENDPAGSAGVDAKKGPREDASWRLYEIPAPAGYVCTAAVSAAGSGQSV